MGLEPDHRVLQEASSAAQARRNRLFRETPLDVFKRWTLGTAWALRPDRIGGLPTLGRLWVADLMSPRRELPDPDRTFNRAGLCGFVHDLSVPTLLEAYRRGLFTFAHYGPLKWMSLDERCILAFDDFHLGKTARRIARTGRYRVTFDRDFEAVLKACAAPRSGRWHLTWITPQIMHAYAALYDAGHAHSFEVWNAEGKLVGGGYGIAIGGAFFTESQFARERDTSKIGFAALNWQLARWGFTLNDGKWKNALLDSLGFRLVPRAAFQAQLAEALGMPDRPGRWELEADLATVAQWKPSEERNGDRPPRQDGIIRAAPTCALLAPVVGALGSDRLAFAETLCALL
jgi:leucyl/phenylalanyl-tRNA--protein transferase